MVSIMAYFCFRQHKRDPSRLPLPKSSHITPSYHPQSNSELFFLVGTLFTTCSHSYSQPRTSAARSPFTESITVNLRAPVMHPGIFGGFPLRAPLSLLK